MQYNISFSTLIFSYQVTRGEQVPMKCPKIKKSLLELLAQQTVTHFSLKIRKFIGSAVSPRNSRGKKRTTGEFTNRSKSRAREGAEGPGTFVQRRPKRSVDFEPFEFEPEVLCMKKAGHL